jgi:hypothetical protein
MLDGEVDEFTRPSKPVKLVEAYKGDKYSESVIRDFEAEQEYFPMIYPSDDGIRHQINNLKNLQRYLSEEEEVSGKWLFWSDQYGEDSTEDQDPTCV